MVNRSSSATPPSPSPAAPPSLLDPHLDPVWEAVRLRLERRGSDDRGRVRLPQLDTRARFLLGALVSGRAGATLDLGVLERALRALGVAEALPAALAALGHPVSDGPAERRAKRSLARAAREAVRAEAASWPEDWAVEWADGIARSGLLAGLDASGARELLLQVRTVLDHLGEAQATTRTRSRTELAAAVLGSAHALDRGTRAGAAVARALAFRHAVHGREADGSGDRGRDRCGRGARGSGDPRADRRAIWALAGAQPDLVSATVLCWNLRPTPDSGLQTLLAEASRIGVPLHLTQYTLRVHPVVLPDGADVLAVENPRVVEAAAEARSPLSVVALSGNPSAAARLLVDQLLGCGARVRYHGDFDSAGLAICGRMHELGLVPWRMDADDYVRAVDTAERAGTPLPTERRPSPATPWSPALRETFDRRRKVVHEELLLDDLLRPPSS